MKYFVHFVSGEIWDREFGKLYPIYTDENGEYLVDEQGDQMRVKYESRLFQHRDHMYVEFV